MLNRAFTTALRVAGTNNPLATLGVTAEAGILETCSRAGFRVLNDIISALPVSEQRRELTPTSPTGLLS